MRSPLQELAAESRRGVSIGPRGNDFVRAAIALGKAHGAHAAVPFAEARWGAGSRAALVVKAAVEGLTTGTSNLVGADSEFFQAVAERSIIGRLTGLHRMPLQVRAVTIGGATATWVAEGFAKPVTRAVLAQQILRPAKVMAVCVVSDELLDAPDVSAEAVIRADLIRAMVNQLDSSFIDPANAGTFESSGFPTEPASITNGVAVVTGTTNPVADLRNLVDDFAGDLDSAFLIMPPLIAVGLSGATYPNVGARGGNVAGIPVITSRNVPTGVIALVDPGGIGYGEGAGELRSIRNGDVLMSDAPVMDVGGTGSPSSPTSASMVSMFQANAVALVVGRAANWGRVRTGAVSLITGANYGAAA